MKKNKNSKFDDAYRLLSLICWTMTQYIYTCLAGIIIDILEAAPALVFLKSRQSWRCKRISS